MGLFCRARWLSVAGAGASTSTRVRIRAGAKIGSLFDRNGRPFGVPGARRRPATALLSATLLLAGLLVVPLVFAPGAQATSATQPSAWSTTLSISPAVVTTTAGSGTNAVVDGLGTGASFSSMSGMSIAGGVAYLYDAGYIRQVTLSTGAVTTVAGDGSTGCSDNSTPSLAKLGPPRNESLVNDGNYLYWADQSCGSGANHPLREMSLSTGAVSTVSSTVYADAVTVGPSGTVYIGKGSDVYSVDTSSGAEELLATLPTVGGHTSAIIGLAADSTALWTTSAYNDGINQLNPVNKILVSTGTVSTVISTVGTASTSLPLVSAGTYLYLVIDYRAIRITKSDGTIAGVAGAGTSGGGYLDGIGAQAWFGELSGIDTNGSDVWVADGGTFRVRKLAPGSPLSVRQPPAWSTTISMSAASVTTTSGSGIQAVTDGPAAAAAFNTAGGMSIANGSGYLYDQSYIRKVTLATGAVATVAGDGTAACLHDSANGLSATVGQPVNNSLANDGVFLYWLDQTCSSGENSHGVLRRMSLATGAVSTIVGSDVVADAVTVGPSGTVYVGLLGNIYSVNTDTGMETLIATLPTAIHGDQKIWSLTADGSYLWAVTDIAGWSAVDRISIATGMASILFEQSNFSDLTQQLYGDGGLVSTGSYLYIANGENLILRMAKTDGTIALVAGTAGGGYANGTGAAGEFNGLGGIDSDGTNMFATDTGNYRVRSLTAALPARTLPLATMSPYPVTGIDPMEIPAGSSVSEACACSQGHGGDPVNTDWGSYYETETDLATPGRGAGLNVSRTYVSSLAGQDGLFGYGWSSTYGVNLTSDAATGDITVHQEDGSTIAFAPTTGFGLAPVQPRELATLVNHTNGSYTLTRKDRTVLTFNATGQLVSVSDLNGNTTTLSYDGSGYLSAVTDPAGRSYTITTSSGRISQISDPASRIVSYSYDGSGNLTSVTDPTGAVIGYTYDSSHRLLTMLDPNQHGVSSPTPLTNVYDTAGRVTSQTDFAGRTTTFDYTSISGATKVTDPAGLVTVDYYTNGQRTKSIVGYGTADPATTEYTYDPAVGAVATVKDPLLHTTTYTYDSHGNILSATDPLGRTVTNTYDSLDDLLTSQDPAGVTSTNTYDSAGNLLTTSRPLLSAGTTIATRTTSYTYGDAAHPGDVTAVTDPLGNVTHYAYDTYGDRIGVTAPATPENSSGDTTTYAYDTDTGWLTSMVSPKGNVLGSAPSAYTTNYAYDNDGRLTRTRDPLWISGTAHQTSATYDADGNVASGTDGNNRTTWYAYDADNELVTTARPDSTTITQTWTADGMLHTRVDGAGHTTTNTYDNRNNLASTQDPLGHTISYTYDLAGNLTLQAASGASCGGTPTTGCTSFAYDDDGELTARSYLDGQTPDVTSIGYDADGRRTGQTDATGTSTWTYDSLGRLTSSIDGQGVTTSYGHDLDGNVTSLSYPGTSHTVTRTFDALNRLASVTDWNGNVTTTSYDENSNPTSNNFPSGTAETDTTTYDAADQLSGITDSKLVSGSPTTLAGFSYTRDGAGQLSAASTTGISEPSQTYSYNGLEQLTASGSLTTPTGYGYNAGDSITNRGTTSGGTASTLAYNAGDQPCWSSLSTVASPSCATVPSGATSYTYDSNGNRTQSSTTTTGGTALAVDVTTSHNSTANSATNTTSTFSTTDANDLLLAYVGSDGPFTNGSQTETVSGAGLSWTLVARANGKYGDSEVWKATASSVLSNVTVAATQSTATHYDQTLTVVAYQGSSGVGASATKSSSTGGQTVSLTTTAAGSLVYGVGNDYTSSTARTVGSGQTMSYQWQDTGPGDDYWVQHITNPVTNSGTSATINDTAPTGHDYNLVAVEIKAGGTSTTTSTNSYSYDEAQNMATSTSPAGTRTSYVYDGDGLRQSKTTGGVTTHFTWDQASTSLPQLLSDDTNYYVYGVDDQPLEQINASTGTVTWIHQDQIGSTRLLTDSTGSTVGTYTYDAYGTQTAHTGTATTPLGYNGQYTDTETGFSYLRARYYDPATAQFTTLDPLLAATGAPYGYAADSPLNGSDPSGMTCSWSHAGGCLKTIASNVGSAALSLDEGFADAITFGGVSALDEAISPGSTCTYAHGAFYVAGGIAGIITTTILTDGASTEMSAAETAPKTIAIGEDMTNRVEPFAQRVGADTYKADPTAPPDQWMSNNRQWINDRMDEGCRILDCGPAPGRTNYPGPTSEYYQMELNEIDKRGYTNYFRVPMGGN